MIFYVNLIVHVNIIDESELIQPKISHRRHASTNSAFRTVEASHGLVPLEPQINPTMDISSGLMTSSLFQRIQSQHRTPRNLHSRSFSDYTHPYPTSSPPHSSGSQLASMNNHRRAISTNTLDLILQPIAQKPLDQYTTVPSMCESASTVTTTEPRTPTKEESGYASDDTTASSKSTVESKPIMKVSTTDANRYVCSYCNKGFSRPSSLRIHVYSHTGERPFECPERGCSRKFSVQSNMRRHLRVHRPGTPLRRKGKANSVVDRSQMINKPLAAKPTVTSSNWIGQTISGTFSTN